MGPNGGPALRHVRQELSGRVRREALASEVGPEVRGKAGPQAGPSSAGSQLCGPEKLVDLSEPEPSHLTVSAR